MPPDDAGSKYSDPGCAYCPDTVRACRMCDVIEIIKPYDLGKHRQPADTGIEHTDRQF